MNREAVETLLRSIRYNVAQIDADLAQMAPTTPLLMYHQGYQVGRKTELESLVTTLEMALAR